MGLARTLAWAGLLTSLTACGSQATPAASPSTTPTPRDILLKFYTSGLKDAHYTTTEQLPDGHGGTVQAIGEGWLVLKPMAETSTVQIPIEGGSPITVQNIMIGTTLYHRQTTDANWKASPGRSELTDLDRSYSLVVVGEDSTPQGRAWHLSGLNILGNRFEIWIRAKDHYPLKYVSHDPNVPADTTDIFDRYNTGQTISPPPATSVVQG